MLVYLIWNIKKFYVRNPINKKYIINMIIISSVHIIVYFYIGFIFGFSKSPYNHEILTMIKNIIIKIIPIISIEVTRSVIANRNKNNKALLKFLTILLILVEINYNTLINLYSNKEELFKYICSTIIPLIASSILYTYLTLKGSYLLVLIYRIYKDLMVLILPILPDIDWFITGSIGILSPTIVYLLFKYKFIKEKRNHIKKQQTNFEKFSYTVALTLAVTIICFMLGVLKYQPIAIISSSMFPLFNRGDVVIYKDLSDSELKQIEENSIIIYKIGNQNIAHRVVNRIEENNTVFYQTKGDSNNVADSDLVKTEQIKGIYVFHVKYIGYPSAFLYQYFNNEKPEVEIK